MSTTDQPIPEDLHDWISFEDPDERRTWMFDASFLASRWTCIYGNGCLGVLTEPAPELEQGCCSYGAHFTDDADRARVEALSEALTDEQWQYRAVARRRGGIVKRERDGSTTTRIVDGACIMLNRPGFPGGAGCALHRAALDAGSPPHEWKPEVCWQLPVRRVDHDEDDGHVVSVVREWKRRDWSAGGDEFHWWCTEGPEAFVGDVPVYVGLRDELVALCGEAPYALLARAMARRSAGPLPHPADDPGGRSTAVDPPTRR